MLASPVGHTSQNPSRPSRKGVELNFTAAVGGGLTAKGDDEIQFDPFSAFSEVRGVHPECVLTCTDRRIRSGDRERHIQKMNSSAWRRARTLAGLPQVRVHDLKHITLGRRLRAAGVSFEDRQDPLGRRSGRVTTHYSAAELESVIAAAERVCGENSRKTPALVVLKPKVMNRGLATD
jgi:hypothetical protein